MFRKLGLIVALSLLSSASAFAAPPACNATSEGTLAYDSDRKMMVYCDGDGWNALGGSFGGGGSLPGLNSAQLWVGNASNAATAVTLSGDATLSNAGVLNIANNAIIGPEISAGSISNAHLAGSIALSKLSITGTGSASNYLRGDGSWAVPAGGGSSSAACTKIIRDTATFTPAAGTIIGYTLIGGGGGGSNDYPGENGAVVVGSFAASGGSVTVYVGGGGGSGTGGGSGGGGGSGYFGGGGGQYGGGGGSTAILDNGVVKAYASGGTAGGPTPTATGGSNVAGAAGSYGAAGASLAGGNSWHSGGGNGVTGGTRETGGGGGGFGGGGGGAGAASGTGGDGGSNGRNGQAGNAIGSGGGSGNGYGGGGAMKSGGNGGNAIITYQGAACSL